MMLTPLDEDDRRALAEKSFMAAAAEVRPIPLIPCCTHCHIIRGCREVFHGYSRKGLPNACDCLLHALPCNKGVPRSPS